jgi:hypothetical protein
VKVLSVWIRTAFFCLRPRAVSKRFATTVSGESFSSKLTIQATAAFSAAAFQAVTYHNSFNATIAPAQPKRFSPPTFAGGANYQ